MQAEIAAIAEGFSAMEDSYFRGARAGCARCRHAADPQPHQDAVPGVQPAQQGLAGDRGRDHARGHGLDGCDARQRVCHRAGRRRGAHRNHGALDGVAGGAGGGGPDRRRAQRRPDHHRWQPRQDRGAADRGDARGLCEAARGIRARGARPRASRAPAGGDHRRGRDRLAGQYRAAARGRSGAWRGRGGNWAAPQRIHVHEPRRSARRGRAVQGAGRRREGDGGAHGHGAHARCRRREAGICVGR